jgi:hypothetical protein
VIGALAFLAVGGHILASASTVLSRLNLTAILAALSVLDLVLDRVLVRLFLPSSNPAETGGQVLAGGATFVSYLAGALALLVFATSFLGLLRRRELFPPSMRFLVSVLALFCIALLALCVSRFAVSGRLFVQLKTSHAFLSWLIALAVWRAPISIRARLGVTLFALPAVLHTIALFLNELGRGRGVAFTADLARIGELSAFLAAGAAPLLLPRSLRGARYAPAAWLLGIVAISVLLAGTLLKFDLVQLLALYGLRLDLPPLASQGAWAYVLLLALAVLGTFLVVLPAIGSGASDRLVAYGVIMLVTSGYQIASPSDLGVAACGLLALAVGVTRHQHPPALVDAPAPVPSSATAPAT